MLSARHARLWLRPVVLSTLPFCNNGSALAAAMRARFSTSRRHLRPSSFAPEIDGPDASGLQGGARTLAPGAAAELRRPDRLQRAILNSRRQWSSEKGKPMVSQRVVDLAHVVRGGGALLDGVPGAAPEPRPPEVAGISSAPTISELLSAAGALSARAANAADAVPAHAVAVASSAAAPVQGQLSGDAATWALIRAAALLGVAPSLASGEISISAWRSARAKGALNNAVPARVHENAGLRALLYHAPIARGVHLGALHSLELARLAFALASGVGNVPLWASSASQQHMHHSPLPALHALAAEVARRGAPALPLLDMVSLMRSFALARVALPVPVLASFADKFVSNKVTGRLSGSDVCHLAWSFARLGVADARIFDDVAAEFLTFRKKGLSALSPAELLILLASFGKVGHRSPALFEAAAALIGEHLAYR